jgi:hypothetical protein
MPIEFHCPFCGKQIRTGDENAGKHGKCPACHQEVYVPTPSEQIEPLKIAPVDEAFEREKERLLRETKELQHRLLHERELPGETAAAGPRGTTAGARGAGSAPTSPAPAIDVERYVIEYAMCMADGKLDRARDIANLLKREGPRTDDTVQRIMQDEILPAPIARIPRPVLAGFFRQLRGGG